jgi:adhesin/invasin
LAGNAVVTATADSAVGTTSVLFIPGTPQVYIEARPLVLPVGVTTRITVTARDMLGNAVLDGTVVTFTTTLGKFNDSQTGTTFSTTSGGQANAVMTSLVTGQAVVQGTVQAQTASVVITFNAGEPYSIALSLDNPVVVGCGGTTTATAVVRDRYGNLVRDGTVIAFEVTPQGDADPLEGGRTFGGIARAVISSGSVPGPSTVWAWSEQWRAQTSKSTGVVFLVGPPDRISVTADPASLRVGGNRAAIKAHVLDCGGYPVLDGTQVTFQIVSGSGQLLTAVATSSHGWAESVLVSPDQSGAATVVARANGREATVVVPYIPGPPELVLVTVDPISIAANGVTTSSVTAQVTDQYGNAVADRTSVVFTTNLGRFSTGSSYPSFTMGGTAHAVFTSGTSAGFAYINCIAGGERGEAIVDMYPVPTPTPPPRFGTSLPIIIKYWR